MAIISNYDVFVPSLDRRVVIAGELEYVGKVIKTYSRTERIMSDVWDTVSYAVVAENDGTFGIKRLGSYEFGVKSTEVDAPVSLRAAYERFEREQEDARQTRETELARAREAQAAALRAAEQARLAALPKRGDKVEVKVDGRCRNPLVKAANGKSGQVFWVRDGRYGVALSDARDARGNFTDVVWCYTTQIVKVAG